VLSLLVPGRLPLESIDRIHPGYLGLAVVALAVLGWRHRLAAVAVVLVIVALGHRVCVGGTGVAPNPVFDVVELLPFSSALHDPARGLVVAAVPMAALAARGAVRIGRIAAPLVAAELLLVAPLALPLPVAESRPKDISIAIATLSEGPVLVIPAGGPGQNFLRPLIDQRAHGRKLLLDPERPGVPDAIRRKPLGRWLQGINRPGAPPPPPTDTSLPPTVAVLVVMEPYGERVATALGPPDVIASDGMAWDIAARR
jgi:hypothetical protein